MWWMKFLAIAWWERKLANAHQIFSMKMLLRMLCDIIWNVVYISSMKIDVNWVNKHNKTRQNIVNLITMLLLYYLGTKATLLRFGVVRMWLRTMYIRADLCLFFLQQIVDEKYSFVNAWQLQFRKKTRLVTNFSKQPKGTQNPITFELWCVCVHCMEMAITIWVTTQPFSHFHFVNFAFAHALNECRCRIRFKSLAFIRFVCYFQLMSNFVSNCRLWEWLIAGWQYTERCTFILSRRCGKWLRYTIAC